MGKEGIQLLKAKCTGQSLQKLTQLDNSHLHNFIAEYVQLCNPDSIYVCDDSPEDAQYIRNKALENKEEAKLSIPGHTVHFDGYQDQARDRANTKYLLSSGVDLGSSLNSIAKDKGLQEICEYLKDIMVGKQMYVLFFCLGPTNSEFSIPCVQITDSSYVAHSEYILYRTGFAEFKKLGNSPQFFRYVHSAGVLENGVSKNVDQRRIYIDLDDYIVYSVNTQYAGNTVGLKKLSLRLAIRKASKEGWLAEHMLVMGICGPGGRVTYFTGAFPSACGKTSTAMLQRERIIGDDIAYLRIKDRKARVVNVEKGIFGIIRDVNPENDPLIWKVLNSPGEVIFSNVLVAKDNNPRWLGDGRESPEKGINYSGEWFKGKKDDKSNAISYAHKNARYTIGLHGLKNLDPALDDPNGVELKGVIYGGRDCDTWPPVQQAFDWTHGVITMGASLESESTAATLGQEGVRQFNPMSNLDFVALPLGQYIKSYLQFGESLDAPPSIFAVNYFLKDKNGQYMTAMKDKAIWIKWMELRINNDLDAIKTPTGYIPKYQDLKKLFKEVLDKDYTEENYVRQFSLRIPENLAKIERIKQIYRTKVTDVPDILFNVLREQRQRLDQVKKKSGNYINPNSV
jgi:phosphoenolpyruvate carboxykinase (GTP)